MVGWLEGGGEEGMGWGRDREREGGEGVKGGREGEGRGEGF